MDKTTISAALSMSADLRPKNSVWSKETRRWIRAVPPPNAVWDACWIEDDDPGDMDQTAPLNRIGLMEITL